MPAGRPKLKLNEAQIKELASIQCTMAEIAAVMNCCVDTLTDNYSEMIKMARESGKSSLRRAQYKAAMGGSVPMLIWLGKVLLGQHEEITLTATNEPEVRKLLYKLENFKKKPSQADEKAAQDQAQSAAA